MTGPDDTDLLRLTFPQLVARQAGRFADTELVVNGATRLTFSAFTALMTDVTRSLMALGVERGDRVAVWAPNSVEWLLAALGTTAAGATLLPMNSRFRGVEAADVVRRCRPRVLFTVSGFLGTDYPGMLRAAAADGDLHGVRVVLLEGPGGDDLSFEQFLALGAAVAPEAAAARRESAPPDDTSDLMLTSGTTGMPKAVMSSHRQNVLAYTRLVRHLGLRTGDRINATLPFFHNFGFKAGFLTSVLIGGTCVCEPVFDPTRLSRLIESERISFLMGTPPVFLGLLSDQARRDADLSSLRCCFVAGAVIEDGLLERIAAELSPRVVTGYGLSELAGAVSMTPLDTPAEEVSGSAGRLVEGVEIRIVDDTGADLPCGRPGEVLARGACVMQGYLDDAGATALAVDPDGWLHTGDVGSLDEEGFLRITDRKKDMFIVGGFNTSPAEVERLLLTHPDIAQAAVVGVPDDRLGEVGAAFLVARLGVRLHPEVITAWARDTMANYKVPRHVRIIDVMPVNASMKILRHELRAGLAVDGLSSASEKDVGHGR